jgi:predicted Fe-Mo cluster-binding NifX family protein
MKIAVACDGKNVSQHFGHCEGFTIFNVENNEIKGNEFFPNPGHRPGFLPVFLHEKGANVVISGGMGGGAIDLFNEKGIEVVVGACGDCEVNVKNYIDGSLKSTESVCHQHQHAHECGNH